jgi:hypothetical protein
MFYTKKRCLRYFSLVQNQNIVEKMKTPENFKNLLSVGIYLNDFSV